MADHDKARPAKSRDAASHVTWLAEGHVIQTTTFGLVEAVQIIQISNTVTAEISSLLSISFYFAGFLLTPTTRCVFIIY